MECRLCGSAHMVSVMDLGATPPCEKFLTAEELDLPEETFPLHLRVCAECLLLQIPSLITPEQTFTEYAYFSSFSDSWVDHARRYVDTAIGRLGLGSDSFMVEVACNDGYLLRHAVDRGIPCLGIEPSENVSEAAREVGVPTVTAFLDENLAADIAQQHRPADLVVANNVYAHIPDLLGFTKALRTLVADDGWVTIEVHHALNLMQHAQFDTIYHEHFQYYTLKSAMTALSTGHLSVVDVELLETHGGSIRMWAQPEGAAGEPSQRVLDVLEQEQRAGLHSVAGYRDFSDRVGAIRRNLMSFLIDCHESGASVVGYGAPGKGNTLLNYCGIRPDLMAYTVDRNPYKHGRFTPGTRIPIYSPERIEQDRPDVVVVLPWNLEKEITQQLQYIEQWGASLVFPMPDLHATIGSTRVGERSPEGVSTSRSMRDGDA
jgi:2-polyprenyl-3-methyl-5-hydroxy-6-metoxy-1,4-benzoquinol methylase